MLLESIKNTAPLAYSEFLHYLSKCMGDAPMLKNVAVEHLPNAFIVGVVLYFFNENEIDFSLADTQPQAMHDAIVEAFEAYEKVISHFS